MFKTLIFFILISLISFNLSADQDKKEIKKDVTDTLHKDLQNRREKNKKKRFKKKPCNTAENCNLKYCKKARYCIERLPCNTTKNCKLKHCKRVKYCKDREVKKVKTPRYMPSQKTKNTNKVKKSKKRTKTQKVVGKLSEFAVMGIESETPTFFSLKTSYHFQHWAPDHIRGSKLDTNTINYFKFKVETFNDFFSIDYETSLGGTSLIKQKELIKLRSDSKTSWEKFLANVEIPYTMYAGKEKFRIYFAYSSEIFLSTLTMKEDKEYISDSDSDKSVTIKKGGKISSQTKFQDYYLGFKTSMPIKRFGLFHTRYDKPYSFALDNVQLDKYIFDSLFTAWGLYLDLAVDYKNFYFGAKFKAGLGDTELKGVNLSLSDYIGQHESDYSLQYLDSTLQFGYSYKTFYDVVRFYIMSELRYRKFFLQENVDDDLVDENGDPVKGETIHLNGDLIFNLSAGLSISF